jgi:asparagine synthase (glutamine-hydrolysing)
MCGIFSYISNKKISDDTIKQISIESELIKHRGPDSTKEIINDNIYIKFHRLSIVDLSESGMQPFQFENETNKITIVCNGEIYNSNELRKEFNKYRFKSESDCEVLIPMFMKYGTDMFKKLDSEFAIIILYENKSMNYKNIIVARDHVGIRPLFYSITKNNDVIMSSEAKSIIKLTDTTISQFPSGYYSTINPNNKQIMKFYEFCTIKSLISDQINDSEETITNTIHELLTEAVRKRLPESVSYGFLLSGGLDSSLVVAIARRLLGPNAKLYTFCVGLSDSPDLIAAKKVADFLGTIHTELKLTSINGLTALKDIIYALESPDQTTIYAGTFQYLLCKYIQENTDIKVILGGELADECNASYKYVSLSPTLEDAFNENIKLLEEVQYYDVLRADRMISSNSLESRVPFSDIEYMRYTLNIPISMKVSIKTSELYSIEKYLLRKAFDNKEDPYLPDDILWRSKLAFSDGVGESFISFIKRFCGEIYSDMELKNGIEKYKNTRYPIYTKDELHFREIYESYFNGQELIPHKWMIPEEWNTGITESSARYIK